jgi:hypothetical protein
MDRFWSKIQHRGDDECWEWQAGRVAYGYGFFQHKRNGQWRREPAHRIAWELTNGPIPNGLFVCHECDNPPCCNPRHLFLGTPRQNSLDMLDKDRASMPQGIRHPRYTARLTEDQVREIRNRWPGTTQQALANEYGVALMTINHILHRRTWAHIR